MIPPLRRPPSAKGRPGGPELLLARVCVVAPWVLLPVLLGTAALAPGAAQALKWILSALVVAAVAGLVLTFARHPAPSRQDGELTFTLVVGSLLMVVPALAAGVWPVAALPLSPPALVVVAAIRERRSHA